MICKVASGKLALLITVNICRIGHVIMRQTLSEEIGHGMSDGKVNIRS